jgi:CMP-N,N'-diacetyllegionaminic acid synthase
LKPICFIAARGGSKGVQKKNSRMIAGKPLIAHTIEKAINSKIFQHVVVSSEDSEIISIAKKFGAEIPFIRPKRLATDSASMNDVLLHAIKNMYSLGYEFETIVNRDCTVPFIQNEDIQGSVELLKRKKCDAVFGVYKQHHNPYFNMMEANKNGFLKFSKKMKKRILTRQSAPVVFQLNGLFTIDVKRFLKYNTLIMPKILPYEISPETGWMIDTEFEFKVAEMIFQKNIVS